MSRVSARQSLAIFDLDGVLIHGDTMGSLMLRRLREYPARFLSAVPMYAVAMLFPGTSSMRASLNRSLVTLALRGLDRDSYVDLARVTGLRLALYGRPNREAIAKLQTLANEQRVVVITASEFHLARAYVDAIGLPQVQVLASRLGFDRTAPHLVEHNVGAAKVNALLTHIPAADDYDLYTDSITDLPLARRASSTILVNPGRRSARRFRQILPGAQVTYWQ